MTDWLQTSNLVSSPDYRGRYHTSENAVPINPLMHRLLFFQESPKPDQAQNDSLRFLDQSERLSQPDQVILFGRLAAWRARRKPSHRARPRPAACGWGELPASGQERPAIPGTMTQDTFVRVYLLVKEPEPNKPNP